MKLAPATTSGKWAAGLLLLAGLCFTAFFGLVAAGERGGDTFFSNASLSTAILSAAAASIASGFAAVVALRRGDRSVLLPASILVGGFVLFFVIAEIAFPH